MCKHGDTVRVRVKISADLSHTGEAYFNEVWIDRCIAPIVDALQKAGIDMRGSCCGHGEGVGEINLQDGRDIYIFDAPNDPPTKEDVESAERVRVVIDTVLRKHKERKQMREREFYKDLAIILNKHSRENVSNTPDNVLANFIVASLAAFDGATNHRADWFATKRKENFGNSEVKVSSGESEKATKESCETVSEKLPIDGHDWLKCIKEKQKWLDEDAEFYREIGKDATTMIDALRYIATQLNDDVMDENHIVQEVIGHAKNALNKLGIEL